MGMGREWVGMGGNEEDTPVYSRNKCSVPLTAWKTIPHDHSSLQLYFLKGAGDTLTTLTHKGCNNQRKVPCHITWE